MEGGIIALILAVALLVVLATGIELAISFLVVAIVGGAFLLGWSPTLSLLQLSFLNTASGYGLSSLPLFILMGFFVFEYGIGAELFVATYKWLGKLPGGLAVAAVAGCAAFATVTGSTTAGVATLGPVSWPEMRKYKYSPRLALSTIAAAGSLGTLIPPSVGLIIIGVMTDLSIGKLFMAGILPGVLVTISYVVTVLIRVKANPKLAPPAPGFPWKEKVASLTGVVPILVIAVLVLGGIYVGFFTPTEAGAMGAALTFLVALAMRRVTVQKTIAAFAASAKTSGFIFLIIICVTYFTSIFSVTQLSKELVALIQTWPLNRYVILAIILFIYLPLGMFIDGVGMRVLTIPFVYPVILSLGFDGIVFAILLTRMVEIGTITPPLGLNVITMSVVAPDVNINDIYIGSIPIIVADLVTIVILVAFPQISLFLPNLMSS